MTAPMPETMSPREKVELKPCPFCGGEASIERFGNTRVSTQYHCDDCGCFLETGEEFNHGRVWNRRPALASSGDHAELARLAEAATRGDWRAHITTKRSPEIYTNVPPPNTPNPKIAGAILRKADARFIAAANPARVLSLLSEIAALRGERDRLRMAVSKSNEEICQSLGKALGYPWFKDDQANFPGSTETDGVCVGDHVAESIADEASRRLTQAERQRDELRKALERMASSEAFETPRVIDGPLAPEMRARLDYARQAIANQGADPAPVKKERAWICPQDNTPCPPECDSDDRRHCASVACKEQPA